MVGVDILSFRLSMGSIGFSVGMPIIISTCIDLTPKLFVKTMNTTCKLKVLIKQYPLNV